MCAVDDVMAWCVLALSTSFAKSGSAINGVYTCLLAITYVLVLLVPIRRFIHFVHSNFFHARGHHSVIDEAELPRYLVLLYFLVLVFSAFAAEIIGIHSFFWFVRGGCDYAKRTIWKIFGESITNCCH